ncbi:glycosyltransferase family 25 protein [Neomicrococcus aestuarii]|uniref:glycosyltransferase family 25 protein n=1 Tax=Neomicrococcus aestuarii TaxID=556325 RepID=UPI000903B8C0|nr:glycosyltransferase family 25 protein [Neomicrococcus aestuarii]
MQRIVKRIVISLADSPRIQGFLVQDQAKGFQVFDAYDGRKYDGREYFDAQRAFETLGSTPTGPQIGCAISHRLVIEEFADEEGDGQDLLLVAEDDARFITDFSKIVDNSLKKVGSVELLLLAEAWNDRDAGVTLSVRRNPSMLMANMSLLARFSGKSKWSFRHRIGHTFGSVWGTGLYLISRRAAKKYKNHFAADGRTHWIADDYKYWANLSQIDVMLCRPGLATWEGVSSITPIKSTTESTSGSTRSLFGVISKRAAPRTRVRRALRSIAGTIAEVREGRKQLGQ